MTTIVVRTDGTDFHFVSRTLSGEIWMEGPAMMSLENLVQAAERFVRAGEKERARTLAEFKTALSEAEKMAPMAN
jgi:hypothetical protein